MKLKRLVALVLVTVLCAVLVAGCNFVSHNNERDMSQVIAVVNGENVYKKEFVYTYNQYLYTYDTYIQQLASLGYSASEITDLVVNDSLELCINDKLFLQKAKEYGVDTLTAEQLAEVEKNYNEFIDNSLSEYEGKYQEKADRDPDFDVHAACMEDLKDFFKRTYDMTLEDLKQYMINQKIVQNLKEKMGESVKITEEDAKSFYDYLLNAQKLAYEYDGDTNEIPSNIVEAYELANYLSMPFFDGDYLGGGLITYYPTQKHVQVKHIQISISDEDKARLSALSKEDLGEAEYQKQYDAIVKEALAKIEDSAKAVLAKVEAGEDFDGLIEEYGQDTSQVPYLEKGGYVVYEGGFSKEFEAACMKLTAAGETTGLVATPAGYHIIRCTQVFPQGEVVPFEDIKTETIEYVTKIQKEAEWNEHINTWNEEGDIVIYKDRLN